MPPSGHLKISHGLMGRQGSPRSPRPGFQNAILLPGSDPPLGRRMPGGDWNKSVPTNAFKSEPAKLGAKCPYTGKRQNWLRRHLRNFMFTLGLIGLFFMFDSFLMSINDYILFPPYTTLPREPSKSKVRFLHQSWLIYHLNFSAQTFFL